MTTLEAGLAADDFAVVTFRPDLKPTVLGTSRAIEDLRMHDQRIGADDEERGLVPLADVLGEIRAEMAANETKRMEVLSGGKSKIAELVGSSNRRGR